MLDQLELSQELSGDMTFPDQEEVRRMNDETDWDTILDEK